MDLPLRAPRGAPIPCKVCGSAAPPFGAVDFNRTCEAVRGALFTPAGVEVAYHRCERCGLIFTEAFDDWSPADFAERIYNAAYAEADPDFDTVRPQGAAKLVAEAFQGSPQVRLLDYGGGNGRMAEGLRAAGFPNAETYDPIYREFSTRPSGRFDVVTCLETLEHMPDPVAGMADMAGLLADDGAILISTLLQPADVDMDWWYIGPRNGHVTLFTGPALARLGAAAGLKVRSFNPNLHLAWRGAPAFARHLLPATAP